jgi:hypothetical protein
MATQRNGELRSTSMLIRMCPTERAAIASRATACRLSVSEYLRRCALRKNVQPRADVDAVADLRRQGGLIKHLASTDRRHSYEYRTALNLIHKTIRRICRDHKRSLETA